MSAICWASRDADTYADEYGRDEARQEAISEIAADLLVDEYNPFTSLNVVEALCESTPQALGRAADLFKASDFCGAGRELARVVTAYWARAAQIEAAVRLENGMAND